LKALFVLLYYLKDVHLKITVYVKTGNKVFEKVAKILSGQV
jgi:hypothetical protein